MPPATSYSKKAIVEAAFTILRKDGPDAISARNIAKALGSSTQPVYSSYASMEELKRDLQAKAMDFAISFLLRDEGDDEFFLGIGMQYLRFARQETALFKMLFMEQSSHIDLKNPFSPPALIEHMRLDAHLKNFDEETLKRLLSDMCIYTHGLATLSLLTDSAADESSLREQLHRMGGIMIMYELYSSGNAGAGFDNLRKQFTRSPMEDKQ